MTIDQGVLAGAAEPGRHIDDTAAQHLLGDEVCASANTAQLANVNIITRTCQRTPRARGLPEPLRRAGSANRPVNDFRMGLASIASKAVHHSGFITIARYLWSHSLCCDAIGPNRPMGVSKIVAKGVFELS